MKVLVDTDVLLDVALDRDPFAEPACRILDHLQANPGDGLIAWHSIVNFYYLVRSRRGDADTRAFIRDLLGFVCVVAGDTDSVQSALVLPMSDLEDALQVVAALNGGAELIVTRNISDYQRAPIPAKTPADAASDLLL